MPNSEETEGDYLVMEPVLVEDRPTSPLQACRSYPVPPPDDGEPQEADPDSEEEEFGAYKGPRPPPPSQVREGYSETSSDSDTEGVAHRLHVGSRLIRRHGYGSADRASHRRSRSGSTAESCIDAVLPPPNANDIAFWEGEGLSPSAATNLAVLSRLVGPPPEDWLEGASAGRQQHRARKANQRAQEDLQPLYDLGRQSGWREFEREFGPVRLRITEGRDFVLSMYGSEAVDPARGFSRELAMEYESRHPKLPEGENTAGAVSPRHEAVVLDLAFLAGKSMRKLTIEGVPRMNAFQFPNCMCALPRMGDEPVGSGMRGREVMTMHHTNVLLEAGYLRRLSDVPTLETLVFDMCPLLDSARIENMPRLRTLVLGVVPLDDTTRVTVDFATLPQLDTLVLPMDARIIRKNYFASPVDTERNTSMDPRVSISECSLRQVVILNAQGVRLKRLFLGFHNSDLPYLATSSGEADLDEVRKHGVAPYERPSSIHPLFSFLSVEKLMMDTTMYRPTRAQLYLQTSRDLHVHTYSTGFLMGLTAQTVQAADANLSARGQCGAGPAPQVTMARIAELYHSNVQRLDISQALSLWGQIMSVRPDVLCLGVALTICMGYANYYRPISEQRGSGPITGISQDALASRNRSLEAALLDMFAAEEKGGGRVVTGASDAKARLAMFLMAQKDTRVPVIVLGVNPLMDPSILGLVETDAAKTYLLRAPYERLLRNAYEEPPDEPFLVCVPEDRRCRRDVTMDWRDLVLRRDPFMPFSDPSDPANEFPMTYLVLVWRNVMARLLPGCEVVASSEDEAIKGVLAEMQSGIRLLNNVGPDAKRGGRSVCGNDRWCSLQ